MRILLVEDDEKLCYSLTFQLEAEGYEVDSCMNGDDAWYYMEQSIHDLILLDRMLPGIDGISLLTKLRQMGSCTPVILLTALGELSDKVTGLDSGADDYLVKPFEFAELLARIRSISRRPQIWKSNENIVFCDITYLPSQNALTGPSGTCTLSKREGALMEFLLRNPSQTLPRNTLLSKVWGPDAEIEDGNLDNFIHFIRRRLNSVGSYIILKTVRGIGYCLTGTLDK